MGCFPACLGLLRRIATMKRVQDQDQCVSPTPSDKIESQKEVEEEMVYPTKPIAESESNDEETVMDVKRHSDELVEGKENGKAEKAREKGKEDEDFLVNDKGDVDSKENSSQGSPVQEESVGSLFSLSIDSRKHIWGAEIGDKEVSSALKMKSTSFKSDDGDKENSKDPVIEQSFDKSNPLSDGQCKRMAVETSLSSWLVELEKSPESENSYRDRVVLRAINSNSVL